jgi:hypothetical protein
MPTAFPPQPPKKKYKYTPANPEKPRTGQIGLAALNKILVDKLIAQGYRPGTAEFKAAREKQNNQLVGVVKRARMGGPAKKAAPKKAAPAKKYPSTKPPTVLDVAKNNMKYAGKMKGKKGK